MEVSFEASSVSALPVILAYARWESDTHADLEGIDVVKGREEPRKNDAYLRRVGLTDVGVFFDWSCLHQSQAGVDAPASRRHPTSTRRSSSMCLHRYGRPWYLVDDQPKKTESGMYYFVESLLNLMEVLPPSSRSSWTACSILDEDYGPDRRGH